MKTATEHARALRYKLRMMGIPCDEPTYVYGDNIPNLNLNTYIMRILPRK
ncbi:hypothetical protein ACHAXN_001100 [Cyclotella atomus]